MLSGISDPAELEAWDEWFTTNFDENQKRKVYMTQEARNKLEAAQVNIDSNDAICKYIQGEVADARKRSGARGVDILQDVEFEELPRRNGRVTLDALVTAFKNFFINVQVKLKLISQSILKRDEVKLRIIQILADKLPLGVALNAYAVAMEPKLLDLTYLRNHLINNAPMVLVSVNSSPTMQFNTWSDEKSARSQLTPPIEKPKKTSKENEDDKFEMLIARFEKLERKMENMNPKMLVNTALAQPQSSHDKFKSEGHKKDTGRRNNDSSLLIRRYKVNLSRDNFGDVFPRASLQVLDPFSGGTWTKVTGILDSGADISVGHITKHGSNFTRIKDSRFVAEIELMDKQIIISKKIGYLNVRAVHEGYAVTFFNLIVYLVDDDRWDRLIIGKPALDSVGLSPESNIKDKGTLLKN
jgi:hypothetical protein